MTELTNSTKSVQQRGVLYWQCWRTWPRCDLFVVCLSLINRCCNRWCWVSKWPNNPSGHVWGVYEPEKDCLTDLTCFCDTKTWPLVTSARHLFWDSNSYYNLLYDVNVNVIVLKIIHLISCHLFIILYLICLCKIGYIKFPLYKIMCHINKPTCQMKCK